MQKLNEFVENLLKEKDISIDDEEVKKQVVADMVEELEKQIKLASVEALPEEKAKELATKLDEPDFTNEKFTEFMQNSGVDFEKITEDVMSRFRKLYLYGEEK